MSAPTLLTLSDTAAMLASGGPLAGKAAFIGVFVLLAIWLVAMPGRLIGQADGRPPWWRNSRVWAIVVVLIQVVVYVRWG